MQVFKAALRTVLRHPLYLLVYAAFLSLMGVFMASGLSFGGSDAAAFVPYETTFSIIDRDGSDLSQELAAYLRTCGIEAPIEDTRTALQDAVAKGQSSYVLIVPPGFGEALMDAARSDKEAPALQTVYSYYSLEGSLMDQEVNEYLNLAHAYAGCSPMLPKPPSHKPPRRQWAHRRRCRPWNGAAPTQARNASCSTSAGAPTRCSPPSS